MKRFRYWLVGLCVWLAILYNLERWNEPINIATFVYVLTMVYMAVVILVPWFYKAPVYWPLILGLIPYFTFRILFGYGISGASLPIVITEICLISVTIILARQVGWRIDQWREVVSELTFGRFIDKADIFETGQGQIYREIRRARLHHRPATLMAICPSGDIHDASQIRFAQEIQHELIKGYATARVAELLVKELHDHDIITQRDDHFVVLLPEISPEEAAEIAANLEAAAKNELGLDLRIGASAFPDEAVTFESLLDQAESAMNRPPAPIDAHLEAMSAENWRLVGGKGPGTSSEITDPRLRRDT
ncbi:MAG: hypothetical protein WA996_04110 [Candidatus Promineifilaceae bacterium]